MTLEITGCSPSFRRKLWLVLIHLPKIFSWTKYFKFPSPCPDSSSYSFILLGSWKICDFRFYFRYCCYDWSSDVCKDQCLYKDIWELFNVKRRIQFQYVVILFVVEGLLELLVNCTQHILEEFCRDEIHQASKKTL